MASSLGRPNFEKIAKFPFAILSKAKGLTAQIGILRFAQNDRQRK